MLIYVVGITLALAMAWFVVAAVIGMNLPPDISGRRYLKKKLAKLGVRADRIPPECLAELVTHANEYAQLASKLSGEGFQFEFVKQLDRTGEIVRVWCLQPDNEFFNEAPQYREILKKYSLPSSVS
jgi:hypothetical protein